MAEQGHQGRGGTSSLGSAFMPRPHRVGAEGVRRGTGDAHTSLMGPPGLHSFRVPPAGKEGAPWCHVRDSSLLSSLGAVRFSPSHCPEMLL